MKYHLEATEDAERQLDQLTARNRKIVLEAIRDRLTHQPTVETRNRKRLEPNSLADWELRVGKYRVFYDVEVDHVLVLIIAVGEKEHNVLKIEGKEYQL